MARQDDFDFESFKKEAIVNLYAGKKMTGTDGVLAPMMKHFLENRQTNIAKPILSKKNKKVLHS